MSTIATVQVSWGPMRVMGPSARRAVPCIRRFEVARRGLADIVRTYGANRGHRPLLRGVRWKNRRQKNAAGGLLSTGGLIRFVVAR